MQGVSFIGKNPSEYTAADIDALLAFYAQITADTGAIEIPVGTTLERPITPANGYIRYNSTISDYEAYLNGLWLSLTESARGGGSDKVFLETSYTVTTNYTLRAGKSAITVGDANGNVTIAAGVTITIPDGSQWSVIGA